MPYFTHPSQLLSRRFSVIIIGGGTAGCALAARLSEEEHRSILLIEAGPRFSNPLVSIPAAVGMLWRYRFFDWGLNSVSANGLSCRSIEIMRGKILGGSSAINAMTHVRGAPQDYENWAAKGLKNWSYANVLPYFRTTENWIGRPSVLRGSGGPVQVAPAATDDPLFDGWLRAAEQAGYPLLDDYNALSQNDQLYGFGRSQQTISKGRRVTARNAYLDKIYHRKNLTILTKTKALRIHLKKDYNGEPRVKGVELGLANNSNAWTVEAADQIISCAGAVMTPHLLMHSGIGPERSVRDKGIDLTVNAPGVGQNYQDHLAVQLKYLRIKSGPFHAQMRCDRATRNFLEALSLGRGPFSILPSGIHGFLPAQVSSVRPMLQFLFRGAPSNASPWLPIVSRGYQDGYGIRPVLLHPESRGRIRLLSADPHDLPLIEGNYLEREQDLDNLIYGVEIAQSLAQQSAMLPFNGGALDEIGSTHEEKASWVRQNAITTHHPCGTCAMGIDDEQPLNSDFSVKGVRGLYVVDASAMPEIISGNINACVYMMAEKAASEIFKHL